MIAAAMINGKPSVTQSKINARDAAWRRVISSDRSKDVVARCHIAQRVDADRKVK
jgi:hypothetical protein